MKNRRFMLSLGLIASLTMSSLGTATASNLPDNLFPLTEVNTEVAAYELKLDAATIETPYDSELYDFVREEKEGRVDVKVVEKASGRVVSGYGEILESTDKAFVMSSGTHAVRLVYRAFYDNGYNGLHFAGGELFTKYKTFQSGSFGEIQSVEEVYWMPMAGGGNFFLESAHGTSTPTGQTGTFPTQQLTTLGSVVLTTQEEIGFGVEVGKFGFSFGTNGYFRYPIRAAAYNITFGR